jgi:hypothetical protein
VSFMLLGMLESRTGTRTLNRSEALPPLTLGKTTVEPVPIDEVLNRLKTMCHLPPKRCRKPIDATCEMDIQRVPCKVTCHFDDSSDRCCTIHLETVETRKEG